MRWTSTTMAATVLACSPRHFTKFWTEFFPCFSPLPPPFSFFSSLLFSFISLFMVSMGWMKRVGLLFFSVVLDFLSAGRTVFLSLLPLLYFLILFYFTSFIYLFIIILIGECRWSGVLSRGREARPCFVSEWRDGKQAGTLLFYSLFLFQLLYSLIYLSILFKSIL